MSWSIPGERTPSVSGLCRAFSYRYGPTFWRSSTRRVPTTAVGMEHAGLVPSVPAMMAGILHRIVPCVSATGSKHSNMVESNWVATAV